LKDLVNFQKNIIITTDYDFKKGKSFSIKYNWNEVFSRILRTKLLGNPDLIDIVSKEMTVDIHQETSGYLGRTSLGFKDLEDYYLKIIRVAYMRNFTAYFRNVILEQKELFPNPFQILS